MWVFLNNAFLSIVDETAAKKHARAKGTTLLVRARNRGDIEAVFGPDVRVTMTPERDYRFRAIIQRGVVEDALVKAVAAIDYGNFKNSVPDDARHDCYSACWTHLHAWQSGRFDRRVARKTDQRSFDDLGDGFDDLLPPEKPVRRGALRKR